MGAAMRFQAVLARLQQTDLAAMVDQVRLAGGGASPPTM
jgi:hypothetical protein